MFEIVRTLYEDDITNDFVAIGYIKGNDFTHSLIVIKSQNEISQFHYNGRNIEFHNGDIDSLHKRTTTIHKDTIPAFIAYCKQIEKKANPQYGYFYSGEFYDIDGNHFSEKAIGERMTCVGFCLNILKGFLEKDYIKYSDWDSTSHSNSEYLIRYATKYNLDVNSIEESHRRISPMEFITSAFYQDLPITKQQIDSKLVYVESTIQQISTNCH